MLAPTILVKRETGPMIEVMHRGELCCVWCFRTLARLGDGLQFTRMVSFKICEVGGCRELQRVIFSTGFGLPYGFLWAISLVPVLEIKRCCLMKPRQLDNDENLPFLVDCLEKVDNRDRVRIASVTNDIRRTCVRCYRCRLHVGLKE